MQRNPTVPNPFHPTAASDFSVDNFWTSSAHEDLALAADYGRHFYKNDPANQALILFGEWLLLNWQRAPSARLRLLSALRAQFLTQSQPRLRWNPKQWQSWGELCHDLYGIPPEIVTTLQSETKKVSPSGRCPHLHALGHSWTTGEIMEWFTATHPDASVLLHHAKFLSDPAFSRPSSVVKQTGQAFVLYSDAQSTTLDAAKIVHELGHVLQLLRIFSQEGAVNELSSWDRELFATTTELGFVRTFGNSSELRRWHYENVAVPSKPLPQLWALPPTETQYLELCLACSSEDPVFSMTYAAVGLQSWTQ